MVLLDEVHVLQKLLTTLWEISKTLSIAIIGLHPENVYTKEYRSTMLKMVMKVCYMSMDH